MLGTQSVSRLQHCSLEAYFSQFIKCKTYDNNVFLQVANTPSLLAYGAAQAHKYTLHS